MNAVVCLDMAGVNTIIKNPETKEPKTFAFDFSYWSHDGFKEGADGELIPLNDKYATQQMVFNDLGQDVLMSAYDGYNSTLFASVQHDTTHQQPRSSRQAETRAPRGAAADFLLCRSRCPPTGTVRRVPASRSRWSATV